MVPDEPITEPQTPPEERKFTQAEVNALLAENKRHLKEANAALQTTLKGTQDEIAALKARLDSLTTPSTPPPASDDLKGQIELLQKRHKDELEAMRASLSQESAAREAAEQRRLETERDRDIDVALQRARCIDFTNGRLIVRPNVEYDDEEKKWHYRLKSGNYVSLDEGVKAELPNYIREAQSPGGGSGSSPGINGSRDKAKRDQLTTAEARLTILKAEADKTGRPADVQQYMAQKRVVDNLKRQMATTS